MGGDLAAALAFGAAVAASALVLSLALFVGCRTRVRESWLLGLLWSTACSVRTKLKAMVTLYQIATRIPTVFLVPFPAAVTALLDPLARIFSFNLRSFHLPLACLGLGSFENELYLNIAAPMALMLVLSAGHVIAALRTAPEPNASRGRRLRDQLTSGLLAALPANLFVLFLTVSPAKSVFS